MSARRLAALLGVLLLLWFPAGAAAEQILGTCRRAPGLSYSILPGLHGVVRPGRWAPVRVQFANRGEAVRGRLILRHALADQSSADYTIGVDLPAQSNKVYFLYFPVTGNTETTLVLEHADQSVLFAHELAMETTSTWPIIVVLGSRSLGLNVDGTRMPTADSPLPLYRTVVCPLDETPDRWIGYDLADQVVLTDPLVSDFPQALCAQSLVDWTRGGGHLVLCVGARWQGVPGSLFAPLIPGELTGSEDADLSRWLSVDGFPALPGRGLRAVLQQPRGRVLLGTAETPLLVRTRVGAGAVTFLATDPNRPPLADWRGLPALLEQRVLAVPAANSPLRAPNQYQQADPAGLVESTPVGDRLGTGWLISTLCAYFVVLGLLDYWLLKRLRRLDWMWFTMTLWVGVFTAICVFLSEFGRERQALERSIRVIDIGDDGARSGVSVTALYSPIGLRCRIAGAHPSLALNHYQDLDRWNRSRSGGLLGDIRGVFHLDSGMNLEDLRIHRGMMITVEGRWLDLDAGPAKLRVSRAPGTITLVNEGDAPVIGVAVLGSDEHWFGNRIEPGGESVIRLDSGGKKNQVEQSYLVDYSYRYYGNMETTDWRDQALKLVLGCSGYANAVRHTEAQQIGNLPGTSDRIRDLSQALDDGALIVLALVEDAGREFDIQGTTVRSDRATVLRLVVGK